MKVFLTDMKSAIQSVLNLQPTEEVGYLLAIFEAHITDCKIERDRFDLLALRNVMVSDEDIEHMNMKKSLDSCTICELHRVSSPDVKSKHVVICISGFLQEDQDKS